MWSSILCCHCDIDTHTSCTTAGKITAEEAAAKVAKLSDLRAKVEIVKVISLGSGVHNQLQRVHMVHLIATFRNLVLLHFKTTCSMEAESYRK